MDVQVIYTAVAAGIGMIGGITLGGIAVWKIGVKKVGKKIAEEAADKFGEEKASFAIDILDQFLQGAKEARFKGDRNLVHNRELDRINDEIKDKIMGK